MHKLKESWVEKFTEYNLMFDYVGERDWGYSFPCDKNGQLDYDYMNPGSLESLANVLYYEAYKFQAPRFRKYEHSYRHPAVWQCNCGNELECPHFTNECEECGALYNWAGQRLSDPSNWGEETGEHPADIMNCDFNTSLDEDY